MILAGQQTAGRGRGSNRWWSSGGAITFSYVTRPAAALDRAHWPRLSLAAAVAVCEALAELAPGLQPGIRWPNDVYVADKKISGILVEVPVSSGESKSGELLVLGLGLNVNNSLADAPAEIRAVGVSLADLTGTRYDLTDVLLRLLERLETAWKQLAAGDQALVRRWQELCLLTGRCVELRLGDRELSGRCAGIGDDGALLLETAAGVERFFGGTLTRVE